jgi:hypothetical protein
METTQGIKRQPEPPAREKSVQQIERDRIYGEYAKLHPKAVEIEDPDDPRYYMDQNEIREFERKKLAAEKGESFQDRMRAERERIFSNDAPPVEGPDDIVTESEAWAAFRERHPELSSEDCKLLDSDKFHKSDPELLGLKAEAWANPGSPSVAAKVLDRAADILAAKRKEQDRRAYVQFMAKSRMPDDSARLAQLQAAMKAGKKL